jgi:hypothetical protein
MRLKFHSENVQNDELYQGLFGKFYRCAFGFLVIFISISLFSLYFIIEAFFSCWSSANSGLFLDLDSKSMAHRLVA